MPVVSLNHINIRTGDVAATLAFYRDVLGLRVGPRPGMEGQPTAGWAYDPAGVPVVHVGDIALPSPGDDGDCPPASHGSGAIDHVAFECSDYSAMRRAFAARGLDAIENYVEAIDLRQLFIRDPNGILIELNFRAA